jgi:hypothetical protein
MSKSKQPQINAYLINLLAKTHLRVYFDNIPTSFKQLYHSLPKPNIKIVIDDDINRDDINEQAKAIQQQISNTLESTTINSILTIHEVIFLLQISTLCSNQLIRTANHRDPNINYKKKYQVISALKAFGEQLNNYLNTIRPEYADKFHIIMNPVISQVSLIRDSFYYNIKKESGRNINICILHHKIKPKQLYKGSLKRAIFPVVELFTDTPKHIRIAKNKIENAIQLPLYIQKHALIRLESRIGASFKNHLYQNIISSSINQRFVKQSPHTYLMEFAVDSVKLGYFTVTVETNIALIRSFKFITMVGTPEYAKLVKYIPTGSDIWKYLNLDSFDTIIESDIKSNPELVEIFKKCGLDYLFEYSKGNNISIAKILLPYLINH